jgi:hypothetical protein
MEKIYDMRKMWMNNKSMKRLMLAASLFLIIAVLTLAHANVRETLVHVSPETYTVPSIGSAFSVNISVQSVTNLKGWEFKLYYPNSLLNGTTVREGPFLQQGGVSTYFLVAEFRDDFNETQGVAYVSCLRLGDPDAFGVDGDGVLATVNFTSISNGGPESLHLVDVKLSDPNATKIPFVKVDGEVTVIPEYSMALILPLLAIITLAAVFLRRKIVNHRGIFHTA